LTAAKKEVGAFAVSGILPGARSLLLNTVFGPMNGVDASPWFSGDMNIRPFIRSTVLKSRLK
jgi:hypothetical protein